MYLHSQGSMSIFEKNGFVTIKKLKLNELTLKNINSNFAMYFTGLFKKIS